MVAYGLQNDALVELAHAHMVGAAHAPCITSAGGFREGAAGSGVRDFVDGHSESKQYHAFAKQGIAVSRAFATLHN